MTTRLPRFTARLDERLAAEFLAHSLALLPIPLSQDDAILSASALRFRRPEPPRDLDLPLLPAKLYPRPEASLVEATVRAMVPPPPVEGFTGRKAEIDQAVISLLSGRPVTITGESGIGKTALLRQIAADTRVRKSFKRVWWLDDLEDAGVAIGLAMNAPSVLRAAPQDQPRMAREFLITYGVLLLVDHVDESDLASAFAFAPTMAVGSLPLNGQVPANTSRVDLTGLQSDVAVHLLNRQSSLPEKIAQGLAALVDFHPRAIGLMAALMSEDAITPDAIRELLQNVGELNEPQTTQDKLTALYLASYEALPEDYRALCRALAASPRRWIALESIVAAYEKPLVAQRALTFLERRGFIERTENTVRAVGNWVEAVPPAETSFSAVVRPEARFLARSGSDGSAQGTALHKQGIALLDEGKDDEAEAALVQALALRQTGDTDHAVAETMAALARLAYLQGDDAGAIRLLETAAERLHSLRDEESLEIVRLALSRVYRRAGRTDAALSVLSEDAPPEDLIAVYRAREEWDEALKVYQRWESNPNAVYGIAEMHAMAGRYADALSAVAGNDSFQAQWMRAMICHMQGDVAKALDVYTRIRLDVPQEVRAPFARTFARALAAMGEVHDAALIVSAEGVWYEAKMPRAIFARQKISQALAAHFNMMLGRLEEAELAVRRAQQLSGERPDLEADAILHRVLGRIAWQRGNLDQALVEFDEELKARSSLPQPLRDEHEIGVTLHTIADVQRQHGDFERAIANYRRALTHKERDFRSVLLTRLALRELLLELGRSADALEAGQQAVELVMRHPEVDLQVLGFILAEQSSALHAAGRGPRADQLLQDWMAGLAERINEGIEHDYWGIRALSIGLYLRSLPEGLDVALPLDLAEEILKTAEIQAAGTWVALAARRDLANIYLRLERWSDALDTFAPLLNVQDMHYVLLAAHLGSAQALIRLDPQENLSEAAAHFDAAREYEPDSHVRGLIARETGEMYRAAGDESRAAERYVQALELLQKDKDITLYVDTLVALAYARLRLRRFNDAVETFEQALTMVENLPDPSPALLSSVLFDMANAHYTLGQYRRAATTYKQVLSHLDMRREPQRAVDTLTAIAHSFVALESYKQALEAYHDALQFDIGISPDQRRTILTEQADVFVRIGLAQSAIDAYRTALALEGGTPVERAAIHRGLGSLYAQLDSHEQAQTHFESALSLMQEEPSGLTLSALGDVYRAQGQLPLAIEAYKRASEQLDRSTQGVELAAAKRAMGEIYLGFGQAFDAIQALEPALEIEKMLPQQDAGRIVNTLQSLGQAHELRGELEQATRRHHEALVYQDARYTPEGYVDTLRTLGRLYMQQSRHDQAAKAYEEALGTEANQPSPDVEKVNDMTGALADVYRAQGRLEAAAKLYKQVMKVLQSQGQPQPQGAAPEPWRDHVMQSLETTETVIARHLQTLNAAEQSWILLNRVAKPDLKGLAFVRALQAQTADALGRTDESRQYINLLIDLLKERRDEVLLDDPRSVMRALAMLLQGHEYESAGKLDTAQTAYRHALDIAEHDARSDAALVWAIRQKVGKKGKGGR